MGCRIIEGDDGAVLYCSTSMWAFGPVFRDGEIAEAFLQWLACDPRILANGDLENKYAEFMVECCDDHGNLKPEEDSDPG